MVFSGVQRHRIQLDRLCSVLCVGVDEFCICFPKSVTMDAVYPEPWSCLHRRPVRKQMHRGSAGRYRTQPVTFAEIKEVDEENIEDSPTTQSSVGAASKSELDINSKFDEFWRAGREKAKEKKHRRAKDFRTSESDAPNAPACTTTSTVITPAPSVTTSAPRNNSSSNNNNTQTPSL